jgi:hypothetical protein
MIEGGHTTILLAIGIGMIALTIVINVSGIVLWLKYLALSLEQHVKENTQPKLFQVILTTVIVLLIIHLIQAFLWAVLYLLLPGHSGLDNLHDAFYFSTITITTLGYGDVTLNEQWRLLSGLESMIGIIVFGMSTAIIFAVIQKCWMFTHRDRSDSAGG